MASWTLTLCLVLLLTGAAVAKRGGSSSSRRTSKSKSSGSSGSGSGSSYPKQQWTQPNPPGSSGSKQSDSHGKQPAGYPQQPPGYPGYPNQHPGYPSAPPAYSPPGHPYPAPPSYPGYPTGGHGYPGHPTGGHGYPGYPTGGHGYPGYPGAGHGYPQPPSYPGGHVPQAPGKSGIGSKVGAGVLGAAAGAALAKGHTKLKGPGMGGIGSKVAVGVLGAVAGAAIMRGHHNLIRGPKMRMYGRGYYGSSSSEEYFEPYMMRPNGQILTDEEGHVLMTEEGYNLWRLAQTMQKLCGTLRQPAVCTLLKLHGLKALDNENGTLNLLEGYPGNFTILEEDMLNAYNSNYGNYTDVTTNSTWIPEDGKLTPMDLKLENVTATTSSSNSTETAPLGEDRLKAAEDLFNALD